MPRIELDAWVPEQPGEEVVTRVMAQSAIESQARRENMTSLTKVVPRLVGSGVEVVPEGTVYPEANPTLDEVVLRARKFGLIYRVSEEDLQDSAIDALREFRNDWARSFAIKFDNAALGTDVAENGTTVPFNSVYYEVATNAPDNLTTLANGANPTYGELSLALSALETGAYFEPADTVVIMHPSFLGQLRNLRDGAGNEILASLDGNRTSLFGFPIVLSQGARRSATASDAPTGNPLMIVGNRRHLINGVRSGPESMVSRDANFETDEPKLKVRARRGFAVARPEAFVVVERA